MLKREGLIEAWHDRKIPAGEEFDRSIDAKLEEAEGEGPRANYVATTRRAVRHGRANVRRCNRNIEGVAPGGFAQDGTKTGNI